MKQTISAMHMEQVTICYGMTETSPVSTQTGADDEIDRRVGSVGRVHPHVEISVRDPDTGRVVERGTTASSARAGTLSCSATGTSPRRRRRRSMPRDGCTPVTSP
jgi:fatty-acyl-CoA synthase